MSDIQFQPARVSPAVAAPPAPAGTVAQARASENVTVSSRDRDNLHQALLDHIDTNPLVLNALPVPPGQQALLPANALRNEDLTRLKDQGIKV